MNPDPQTIPTSSPSQNPMTVKYDPDKDTLERIKHLAYVGTALLQNVESENTFGTNYFLAKEALNNFRGGIAKLNLDPVSIDGMENLIKYLEKKIEKRMKYSDKQNDKPLV
jgi:hypothetical protein